MKKIFLVCAAFATLAVNAEVYTLDVQTITSDGENSVIFDTTDTIDTGYLGNTLRDVWVETLNSDETYRYLIANEGVFMFSHLGHDSYWGGFTVSKIAVDTLNALACTAKGGVAGVGTPYLIGYYSEGNDYYTGEPYFNTEIVFSDEFYPTEVKICQNSATMFALQNGLSPARAFTEDDKLTLTITGVNISEEETNTVTYLLADGLNFKSTWETIDLSSIGKCIGLKIRMSSTDKTLSPWDNKWYDNTPAYFALDGLQVSTENPATGVEQAEVAAPKATKRIINGQLYIEKDGVLYTATGVRL